MPSALQQAAFFVDEKSRDALIFLQKRSPGCDKMCENAFNKYMKEGMNMTV